MTQYRTDAPAGTSDMRQTPSSSTIAVSGRSRVFPAAAFEIAATGVCLPQRVVTNADLAALGCDDEWIIQRTGIRQRRMAAVDEATSDLAYRAAIDCLQRADVAAHEVDLILVATITPDHATPSTACIVQDRLGCIAPAMDINAACSGFVYAMSVAAQYVAGGAARCAMVIGAEVMSRTINPADVKTYPLFGDGAAAALLRPVDNAAGRSVPPPHLDRPHVSGFLGYTLGAEGIGGPQLVIPAGGSRCPLSADAIAAGQQYLQMDGRSVFKWAVRIIRESCQDILQHCGLSAEQIDAWVLHQANIRIIDAAMQDFSIPPERLIVNLDRVGNTSAASVGLALHEAIDSGRVSRGDLVMLCGFGAGLTWGSAVLRL